MTRNTLRSLFIISFLIIGILPNFHADAGTLDVFTEAVSIIEKYHIAQPSRKELYFNAVRGMEAIAVNHGVKTRVDMHWDGIGENDKEALRLFQKAYDFYRKNTPISEDELIYAAINGAIKFIDPNSYYFSPKEFNQMKVDTIGKGNFAGIGIEINKMNKGLTVITAIKGTPAFNAGIKRGDVIKMIDDKSTENMSLVEAVSLLRGHKDTKVILGIMRDGFDKPQAFELMRGFIKIQSVESRILDEGIGYIRINLFQMDTYKDVLKSLEGLGRSSGGLKILILDLRDNPGGPLNQAVAVSGLFLYTGSNVTHLKSRMPDQNRKFDAQGSKHSTYPPIIILINGGSASEAEIVAGALHDNQRAILIGARTFGKGSMNSIFPLRNGSALMLTTARYYTPSGHTFEATGIEPDVEVAEEGDTDRPLDIARSASKKLKNADLSSKEVAIQLLKAKVEEAKDGGKPK